MLKDWDITRVNSKPFKSIVVTAPNGASALVSSHDRNPDNILYMLCDTLLTNEETNHENLGMQDR